MKLPAVYIVTSGKNGTLYIGVTSNLVQRVGQHKQRLIEGFSKKYKCTILVYYEQHPTMDIAIRREKKLKALVRKNKLKLIENANPEWSDLYEKIL
jgi:putative endonuclease